MAIRMSRESFENKLSIIEKQINNINLVDFPELEDVKPVLQNILNIIDDMFWALDEGNN